ncbi:MAG: hypothetical protein ACOCWG_05425 [bacterium]
MDLKINTFLTHASILTGISGFFFSCLLDILTNLKFCYFWPIIFWIVFIILILFLVYKLYKLYKIFSNINDAYSFNYIAYPPMSEETIEYARDSKNNLSNIYYNFSYDYSDAKDSNVKEGNKKVAVLEEIHKRLHTVLKILFFLIVFYFLVMCYSSSIKYKEDNNVSDDKKTPQTNQQTQLRSTDGLVRDKNHGKPELLKESADITKKKKKKKD